MCDFVKIYMRRYVSLFGKLRRGAKFMNCVNVLNSYELYIHERSFKITHWKQTNIHIGNKYEQTSQQMNISKLEKISICTSQLK